MDEGAWRLHYPRAPLWDAYSTACSSVSYPISAISLMYAIPRLAASRSSAPRAVKA
jgi:hypothetical protein